MTDFERLLGALTGAGVEFIVIGGFAATAHGSAHLTVDLDVVYRRTAENVARLVRALEPLRPYLPGAPPGLPFRFDAETVQQGLNFTLVTLAGDLGLLGEATGGRPPEGPRAYRGTGGAPAGTAVAAFVAPRSEQTSGGHRVPFGWR